MNIKLQNRGKKLFIAILLIALCLALSACDILLPNSFGNTSGMSAYEIAVKNGYTGSEAQWLESLRGTDGADGADAAELSINEIYSSYLLNGGTLTFDEFLKEYLSGTETLSSEYAASKALRSAVSVFSTFGSSSSGGAGVIISMNKQAGTAYVVTNYHVVYNPSYTSNGGIGTSSVYIYGREYSNYAISAVFVGGSMASDVAILRITDPYLINNQFLTAAEIYDSDSIHAGQTVFAVGNPKGEGISVTRGVVSVVSENINMQALNNTSTQEAHRVIRVDAPINSGNSGGGLFDSAGRLIGIVNAKSVETNVDNIGYAVPSTVAIGIAQNIIDNNGTGKKLLVGITTTVSDTFPEYDPVSGLTAIKQSVYITSIDPASPASGSGLAVNDIILAASLRRGASILESKAVNQSYSLTEFMYKALSGDVLILKVLRGQSTLDIEVTLSSSNYTLIR